MLAGELYDPLDPLLCRERLQARDLCQELNASGESETARRATLLRELLGYETDVWLQPPFFCDYGTNLHLGRKVFFNFNCVVLDVMPARIGDYTLFGPAVQIHTATHPLNAEQRRAGLEFARPVELGSDVWVGGGAITCPGVRIGSRSVIGSGSVVTRNIRDDVVAVGNPCRVLRPVTPEMRPAIR